MAAIRLFRQGMIGVVMAESIGRLNMLSSLIGNLALCDGDAPLFSTWIEGRSCILSTALVECAVSVRIARSRFTQESVHFVV